MNYEDAKDLLETGQLVQDEITRRVEEAVCALAETGCTQDDRRALELAAAYEVDKEAFADRPRRFCHVDPGLGPSKTTVARFDVRSLDPEKAKELLSRWRRKYKGMQDWIRDPLHVCEDVFVPVPSNVVCDINIGPRGPSVSLVLLVYAELWDGRRWLYCPSPDMQSFARAIAWSLISNDYGFHPDTVFVEDFDVVRSEIIGDDGHFCGPVVNVHVVATMESKLYLQRKDGSGPNTATSSSSRQNPVDINYTWCAGDEDIHTRVAKGMFRDVDRRQREQARKEREGQLERMRRFAEISGLKDRLAPRVDEQEPEPARIKLVPGGGTRICFLEADMIGSEYSQEYLQETVGFVQTVVRKTLGRDTLVSSNSLGDMIFSTLPLVNWDEAEFRILDIELGRVRRDVLCNAVQQYLRGNRVPMTPPSHDGDGLEVQPA